VAAARKGQGIPAALGRWFDNSKGLSPAEEAVPAAESAPSSGLSRGASREIHPPAVPAPRQSLLRSARAGLVVGVIGVALEYAIHFTALFLGYQFHPSYRGVQTIVISSLWDVARVASSSAIFMPIAEEVVFRAGLIGVFSWLGAKVADNKLMKVYLPALAGSLVFVGLHENADPLSFGIRLVLSLLLSAVYQKEGLMASIAAHMTNNLIPTAGIVGQWLLGPGAWGWQTFLILGAFAALAYKALKAEGPSGSARAVTPREALILAALTLAGIFLASLSIKTVIVCSIAAALLLAYAKAAGTRKWRKPA
jgi:membrane protease YdiL (CAAX protease family)